MFDRRQEDRFERDVLRHVDAAFNLARWIVGNDHDAQDAVQEAKVRAFRSFDRRRGSDSKAWFLAIVRNSCMNLLRSRSRLSEMESGWDEASAAAADRGAAPDEVLEIAQDADRIKQAIDALPVGLRELIILREFEQMSYREIAEVASIPIGTVMSRLSRARERLYHLLCEGER